MRLRRMRVFSTSECMGMDGENNGGQEGKKSGCGENERGKRETHGLALRGVGRMWSQESRE